MKTRHHLNIAVGIFLVGALGRVGFHEYQQWRSRERVVEKVVTNYVVAEAVPQVITQVVKVSVPEEPAQNRFVPDVFMVQSKGTLTNAPIIFMEGPIPSNVTIEKSMSGMYRWKMGNYVHWMPYKTHGDAVRGWQSRDLVVREDYDKKLQPASK